MVLAILFCKYSQTIKLEKKKKKRNFFQTAIVFSKPIIDTRVRERVYVWACAHAA